MIKLVQIYNFIKFNNLINWLKKTSKYCYKSEVNYFLIIKLVLEKKLGISKFTFTNCL